MIDYNTSFLKSESVAVMGCGSSQLTPEEQAILDIGVLLHKAEEAFDDNKSDLSFRFIGDAAKKLPNLGDESIGHYTILVATREGNLYFRKGQMQNAAAAYTKAIVVAEEKIEARCRGLYLMLQRYADCMVSMAKIWLASAEKHTQVEKKRRDNAKAEMVLLRCIETIEEGHNRRSDLLIDPLILLAEIYKKFEMYSRAELLVRRCSGILIVQYGHDHPQLIETKRILDDLVEKKERVASVTAARKIQSTWRMYTAMVQLGKRLGKERVKRHTFSERRTPSPPNDYLSKLKEEMGEAAESERGASNNGGGNSGSIQQSADVNLPTSKTPPAGEEASSNPLSIAGPMAKSLSTKSIDSASKQKAVKGLMEPILCPEQAPPRVWTVPVVEGESDVE